MRLQVLQHGEDPEVEPGQASVRVWFDWPGRAEGGLADPKTVHAFLMANETALGALRAGLAPTVDWVEFRPAGQANPASPHTLAYRIVNRPRPHPPGR